MYKLTKRLIDLILATIALILLSPLLIPSIIILLFTGEHEVFYFSEKGLAIKINYLISGSLPRC